MLIYGDRSRCEDARDVLDELSLRAGGIGGVDEPWIVGHARLVGLLIRAGELVQGLDDADFATVGADRITPDRTSRAAGLSALAGLVLRSWDRRLLPNARECADTLRGIAAVYPTMGIATKTGEGYAFYAVYPEAYGIAASPLVGAAPTVIGLRSIGATLGAVVAARTGAPLFLTLRPTGDPFDRRPALAEDLRATLQARRDGSFALVDEGPGLSGSSMAGCARALDDLGAQPERIHFLPSHPGMLGPAASEAVRARWAVAPHHVATFDDLVGTDGLAAWVEDLTGPPLRPLQDIGAGRWRDVRTFAHRPPGGGRHERRKYLLTSARGTFLLRFAGLGAAGEAVLRRAELLSEAGFTPPVLGLRHGFLVEQWLQEARPLDPAAVDRTALIEPLAAYLAFRALHLRAGPGDGASLSELVKMVARNSEILLGHPIDVAPLAKIAARLGSRLHRVSTDNRLHRWEWLSLPDGRLFKADAADHCAAHDLVGCQDIAWDVAGARIELELDDASFAKLLAALVRRGVAVEPELIRLYTPCYAAFQAGTFYLDASTATEYPDTQILSKTIETYRPHLAACLFQRIRWNHLCSYPFTISMVSQKGGRMSQSSTTTDHDIIRRWTEERGGHPARVKATGSRKDPGILRLDFGEPDDSLEEISWDEFFQKFDENELALLFEKDSKSRFNKLIHRRRN